MSPILKRTFEAGPSKQMPKLQRRPTSTNADQQEKLIDWQPLSEEEILENVRKGKELL